MLITGNVLIGASTKLIAEALRISYFLETDAKDMARLSVFFMVASSILIISNLL